MISNITPDARFTDADARHITPDARFTDADARFTDADARHVTPDARHVNADARFTDAAICGDIMKFLAIDYGAKRLGLAIADEADGFALPHGTHARRVNDNRGDIAALISLIKAHEIGGVVMGAPASGSATGSQGSEQTEVAAVRFAGKLEDAAKAAGLALKFHRMDERYSSALAARGLRATGVSARRAREEGLIDAGAASVLLQTFIDARQTATPLESDFDDAETSDS